LFLGLIAASPLCRAADTIAVIPLFNLNESKSPDLDWIGESVAETVHESLRSVGLLVLPREDREEVYHRLALRTGVVLTRASVIKIGQTLDAEVQPSIGRAHHRSEEASAGGRIRRNRSAGESEPDGNQAGMDVGA
jgi:hypothetical protein